jgi:putative ABC transport system substrate-binding protein
MMMVLNRRQVVRLTGGLAMLPMAVGAQSNQGPPKIGYVNVGPEDLTSSRVELILSAARSTGHALPQVQMVVRALGRDPAKLPELVKEVLDRDVSVFIAAGPAVLRLAVQAKGAVPIVAYDFETDPVATGYAQSLPRPGGNVTGIFLDFPEFSGKWIELLRECVPQLRHFAIIWDPSAGRLQVDAISRIAAGLNMQADLLEATTRDDFAGAFAVAKDRGAGGIVLLSSPLVFTNAKDLAALALRHRLPAVTLFAEFSRSGGLFSYGPSLVAAVRQAGVMAGKVLGGTPPANLPIERPSKFELLVNQRTAEALGITIPASIQGRADEVIE